MNFAVILAGGIGSRMGNTDTPKQYMELGSKPIIIHTIEKFFVNESFKHVIVLTPAAWVDHTDNLIRKSLGETDKISVIEGGTTRNETLYNAVTEEKSKAEVLLESLNKEYNDLVDKNNYQKD